MTESAWPKAKTVIGAGSASCSSTAKARSSSACASITPTRRGRCRRAGSTRARSRGRPHFASSRRKPVCPERLKYDLPPELQGKLWGGKWKGQDQDWYLARFLGDDGDVNIATHDPEFREWKWIEPEQLPDVIVPFKRGLYRRLLSEFAEYL
jgi:hypothetical protein